MAADVFDDRLFVATVTPYARGGYDVDEQQFRRLLRLFTAAAADGERMGLIAVPEAGEIYYLNRDEKRRLIQVTVEEAGGDVPVLAGISENATADAVEAAVEAEAMGVDGLFVMPPIGAADVTTTWNATRYPEVLTDLLAAITDAVPDAPIICHPTTTPSPQFGIGLPTEVALRVCREFPQVVGWKMTYSYGGHRIVGRALRELDREVKLYASSAPYFHEYMATERFDGTVTGALNYAMEPMLAHLRAWRDGDLAEARRLWDGGLAELHEYVYGDYARLHIRYKIATWLRGLIDSPLMRPPLPRPSRVEADTLARLLGACGIDVIAHDAIEDVVAGMPP